MAWLAVPVVRKQNSGLLKDIGDVSDGGGSGDDSDAYAECCDCCIAAVRSDAVHLLIVIQCQPAVTAGLDSWLY